MCPVCIRFSHGKSTTDIKVQEAPATAQADGQEIDLAVNIRRVLVETRSM